VTVTDHVARRPLVLANVVPAGSTARVRRRMTAAACTACVLLAAREAFKSCDATLSLVDELDYTE